MLHIDAGKEKSKTGIEQSQAEAGTSQPAPRAVAVTEAAPTGTIPVMMPEKLAKGRYLIQLEPNEGGVTDLAGDMGTVGRFTLSGELLLSFSTPTFTCRVRLSHGCAAQFLSQVSELH